MDEESQSDVFLSLSLPLLYFSPSPFFFCLSGCWLLRWFAEGGPGGLPCGPRLCAAAAKAGDKLLIVSQTKQQAPVKSILAEREGGIAKGIYIPRAHPRLRCIQLSFSFLAAWPDGGGSYSTALCCCCCYSINSCFSRFLFFFCFVCFPPPSECFLVLAQL